MSTGVEHEAYLDSMISGLIRMVEQTKTHMATCSCHVCIYKRDIGNRPEIISRMNQCKQREANKK